VSWYESNGLEMKLKLGHTYMTYGPKGQQSLSLPFWDEDSRGSPFRCVRLSFKTYMTGEDVAAILKKAVKDVEGLSRQ